jgi:TolB-like protein
VIYLAMRALGIGPAATLLATGALERGGKIILADFTNLTDDPTLGPSMTEAIRVDLSQSWVVSLMDASVIAETLRRMEHARPAQLDAATAREVAEREGIKAVVTGEVHALGAGYLLLGNLVSPTTGDVLASVRETAADDAELIVALDRLSAGLRDRIGEPLKAIRASPSLDQVTTPSLAALRQYSQAKRRWQRTPRSPWPIGRWVPSCATSG